MAITDYIPNVFGSAAPTTYEGLLGMGLISPEQMQKTQNTANIQGLLGAGLSLAQGMSRIGPRRSAAENILGALSGGFGAAGGAYQQGLQNVVQQQQLQSAALTQAQATNKLKSMQQAKAAYPDLAPLADIDPSEFVKQVIARDRAKIYGFGPDAQPTQMPAEVPAAMPTQTTPQVRLEPGLSVTSKGEQFVGVPNFTAGEKYLDENLNQQARQSLQQNQAQSPNVPLINPANVAKAADNRRKAALAMSMGDKDTAAFFQKEADRLDPTEVISFRDGMAFSNKRGLIANYGGTKPLTEKEVIDNGLDPNKRYQRNFAGNITEIPTTAKVVKLTDEQAQAEGLSTSAGQKYVRLPSNEVKQIEGTGQTKLLTSAEITNNNLDPNKAYQVTPKGDISVVTDVGSVANKADLIKVLPAQFTGVYPTLKPSVDALIARAPTMTRDQIITESEKILADDAAIRKELDPKLAAQRISERVAGAPKVYTGQLDKSTTSDVQKSVITTADAVTRLNNIQFSYRPEYQNIGFRSKQSWNTLKDKVGILSPAEKTQLTQYSQYKQNALQNLNQTIKDITGAAMGIQEADRIISTLPNAGTNIFDGDSPTEFEAKLNNAIAQTKYALARKNYSLRKGLNWESTALDKMPNIINSRGAEIAKQYNLDPKKPADLNTINRQLAAEFGVSF